MRNDIDTLFDQMRTGKLHTFSDHVFEIDINDESITKSPPLIVENNDLRQLQDRLPPSFIEFIRTIGNGIHIEIGNALTIFPVGEGVSGYWTNVLSLTTETIAREDFLSKDFVFFAMSGVDGEMFAFYTAAKFDNGEFPIVWFTPGSVNTCPFVFINSGFDKFLTIQYYLLKATTFEETYVTFEEAAKASSEKSKMEQDERNWQNFQNKLYDTFDRAVPKPNHDFYKSALTLSELTEIIERTKQSSR